MIFAAEAQFLCVQVAHMDRPHLYFVFCVGVQVAHLDGQEESSLLGRGYITFLPLRGEKIDQDAARRQVLTVGRLRTKA